MYDALASASGGGLFGLVVIVVVAVFLTLFFVVSGMRLRIYHRLERPDRTGRVLFQWILPVRIKSIVWGFIRVKGVNGSNWELRITDTYIRVGRPENRLRWLGPSERRIDPAHAVVFRGSTRVDNWLVIKGRCGIFKAEIAVDPGVYRDQILGALLEIGAKVKTVY
jgi:hypothetical protein